MIVGGIAAENADGPGIARREAFEISTVVVLPAPFGPSKAKTSPTAIVRSTPATARTGP